LGPLCGRRDVAVRVCAHEQLLLEKHFGNSTLIYCASDAAFFATCHSARLLAIVWEISPQTPRSRPLPDQIIGLTAELPLLVRADRRAATFRDVLTIARQTVDWAISFRGFDDFASDIRDLINGVHNSTAYQTILLATEPHTPAQIADLVTAAVIMGRRR
jgi:hypothetical protein